MAGRKRTRDERDRDAERIAALHLTGHTQAQIAAQLAVSQQTISAELRRLRDEWRKRAAGSFDERQAEQLARLDSVERTAWAAWERSLGERTRSRTRRSERPQRPQTITNATGLTEIVPVPPAVVTDATVERTERDGNPAYLQQIGWCLEQRAKLLGLYAPTKLAPTDPSGSRPYLPIEAIQRGTRLMDEVDEIMLRLGLEDGTPPGESQR